MNLFPCACLGARQFQSLKKYNPFSLDWISLATHVAFALRNRRFDWAFSGRMDCARQPLCSGLSGAIRRIGYGIGGGGSFLTDEITPTCARRTAPKCGLRLLRPRRVFGPEAQWLPS